MKITVLGLGYIGLPTGLLLANSGHTVYGFDTDKDKITKLQNDEVYIQEKGLDSLFNKTNNKTFFPIDKLIKSDVFIIAVPTPLDHEKHCSDLSYFRSALELIAPHLEKGNLIVIESTVPPGTGEKLVFDQLKRAGFEKKDDILISHCPERAIPGNTLYEMKHNDRIIGGLTEKATKLTKKIYSSFVKGNIFETTITTAETIKLMENTYRDINIALANEFALIAEDLGINVWEAISLANKHPRVDILWPGPGVGGHCLPIDPWFLTQVSTKGKIINTAREINDNMPQHIVKLIKKAIGHKTNPTITILGLTYKKNVDDYRESPGMRITSLCEKENWNIKTFDPFFKKDKNKDIYSVIKDSDCIVFVTAHDVFKELDISKIASIMRTKTVIDTRNFLDKVLWKKYLFDVFTLGSGIKK